MTENQELPYAQTTSAATISYDPRTVEEGLYDWWDERGYFAPIDEKPEGDAKPWVTIMPPPNVTGVLHVGHALFVALQDIMARWHRMQGQPVLWLPGADHAGIGGQWVVERMLADEGLTRHDLGREKFLERMWQYMDEYRPRIRAQMKLLGASCDWSRFTFTMDPKSAKAVRHAFKHLFDKGLIYRGNRLISWCPRCRTAVSDLEVKHREESSFLWHLEYEIDGTYDVISVATSRPETMLGDTGVAVHPDDARYRHLIGKCVRLPIVDRLIPIFGDEHVDPSFGTGAVKVTPAHDPNDYEIGLRHELPAITILNLDGTLNDEAGPFEGMTIDEGREAIVDRAQAEGWLVTTEPHVHSIGHCERCDTVVQPMISKQWFISMEDLARPAIDAANDGTITFVPERYKGTYTNWMENLHDWCISRQQWWGHRIPVWSCQSCSEVHAVLEETLEKCPSCGGAVEQDPDVLDTWFSAGLWPFSTLGWPEQTVELKRFYPGDVMETGYEILYLWVSRMIFFGIELMGEVPYHTIYLHGIVRDVEGAKMSKTKGNGIDPIDISSEYGADALRYTLVTQASPGNDSRLSIQKVEASRNFGTKLWNATRFVQRSIGDQVIMMDDEGPTRPTVGLSLADRWILSRLDDMTETSTRLLGQYLFGEAGRQINEFIWNELCDWYIEAAKIRQRGSSDEQARVAQVLAYTIERSLRLLHPFMPFITEALWQQVPHLGQSVMIAAWPKPQPRDIVSEREFGAVMDMVSSIRTARAEAGVEPARWISAVMYAGEFTAAFEAARGEFGFLARVDDAHLTIKPGEAEPMPQSVTVITNGAVAVLPLTDLVDFDIERERLTKELDEAQKEHARATGQLTNENFVSRAPEKVIAVQRERLTRAIDQISVISRKLEELNGADQS